MGRSPTWLGGQDVDAPDTVDGGDRPEIAEQAEQQFIRCFHFILFHFTKQE